MDFTPDPTRDVKAFAIYMNGIVFAADREKFERGLDHEIGAARDYFRAEYAKRHEREA